MKSSLSINYKIWLKYIAVLMTVLLSKTVVWGMQYEYPVTGLAILSAVIVFAFEKKINIKNLLQFLLLSGLFLLNIILHLEALDANLILYSFKRIAYCFLALLIVSNISRITFCKLYTNIMYYMSWCSLFFLSIKIFFPGLIGKISYSFKGSLIYASYICNPFYTFNRGDFSEIRNYGPFWEPGAFQGFLVIALLCLFVCQKELKNSKRKLIILVITLISTQSTTGYIGVIIIIVAFYKDIETILGLRDGKQLRKLVGVLIMLMAVGFIWNSGIITTKLFTENSSKTDRFHDLIAAIETCKVHPFIGFGSFDLSEEYYRSMGGATSTASLLSIWYTFGFGFFTLYIGLLIKGLISLFDFQKLKMAAVFLLFLILYFTEEVYILPLYFCFLFTFHGGNSKNAKTIMQNKGSSL